MTNKEAIARIKEHMVIHKMNEPRAIYISEALDMAIKALEQQSSEDCISREEVIRVAEQGQIQGYEWQFKKLCTLPSVTPQQKVGKWMATENEDMNIVGYYCSYCDLPMETEEKTTYCPNCGAKMEVEE